jgi:protein tyrosine phosphatase
MTLTNSEVWALVSLKYKFHYIYLSVDHTRVKLKDVDPNVPGAEYINANYIKVICTIIMRAPSCSLP